MEVITIDSKAFNELINKIERIASYVAKIEVTENTEKEQEIWLDTQEAANLLRVSTRTLQRLRTEKQISYSTLRGRCLYSLTELQKTINDRLISSNPTTLEDFRKNYLLKNGAK